MHIALLGVVQGRLRSKQATQSFSSFQIPQLQHIWFLKSLQSLQFGRFVSPMVSAVKPVLMENTLFLHNFLVSSLTMWMFHKVYQTKKKRRRTAWVGIHGLPEEELSNLDVGSQPFTTTARDTLKNQNDS